MECKACGHKVHYCGFCDTEECCEKGFCSDKCMYGSDNYLTAMANFICLEKSFSDEQAKRFKRFMEDDYFEYENEFDTYINSIEIAKGA